MPIIVKENESGFEPLEPGTYKFVCSGVWDIGLQKCQYMGQEKVKHQCVMRFEVDLRIKSGKFQNKRYTLNKYYTLSLGSKSNLRKDLESWRGKQFTDAELQGFDIEKVIGVCGIVCVVNNGSGKTIIASIMGLPKEFEKMIPELDPKETPEWVEKLRQKSKENEVKKMEFEIY